MINADPRRVFGVKNSRPKTVVKSQSELNMQIDMGPRDLESSQELDLTEKHWTIKVMYYIFRFTRAIYTSVYYYFFPLIYCCFPLYNLLISGKIEYNINK